MRHRTTRMCRPSRTCTRLLLLHVAPRQQRKCVPMGVRVQLDVHHPRPHIHHVVIVGCEGGVCRWHHLHPEETAHTTGAQHRAGVGNVRQSLKCCVLFDITPSPEAVSTPAGLLVTSAHCVWLDVDREKPAGVAGQGRAPKPPPTPWCSLQRHTYQPPASQPASCCSCPTLLSCSSCCARA